VQDTIETLKPEDGRKAIAELERLGARRTTTEQVLMKI